MFALPLPAGDDAYGRRLRVGILTRVAALQPWDVGDLVSFLATEQIFETPLRLLAGDEPEPILFDGPLTRTPTDAGDVYRARIKPGVMFSDGTELRAEHVADSLRKVALIRTQARIEARADEVLFHLDRANPRFPAHLTVSHCGIALQRGGELLGTGPFRRSPEDSPGSSLGISSAPSLDRLMLEPNPYHRGHVSLPGIEFTVYPVDTDGKPTALVRAMADNEIDFTNMLSRTDVADLQGCKKKFQPSISTGMLFLNTERPVLRDVTIRRAIAHAVDRRALTEITYSNVIAFTAATPLPPRFGLTSERLPFDPDEARGWLAKAEAVPSQPLRLLQVWAPRPYLPHPSQVAEALRNQLADIGIPVKIEVPLDADEFFGRQKAGDYDLLLGGWIADLPDPAEFLTAVLHSSRIPRPDIRGAAQGNLARVSDKPLDAALEAYQREDSDAARERVLDRAAAVVPVVPIMYGATALVHSWHLRNLEISPFGVPNFGGVRIA